MNPFTVDSSGSYKYYELLGSNDKGHVKWREKIGAYVVAGVEGKRELKLEYFSFWLPLNLSASPLLAGSKYIMEGFPTGYELYAHCSKSSNGPDRRDLYLYGTENSHPCVSPRQCHIPRSRQL